MNICIFCASSPEIDPIYLNAAKTIAEKLHARGDKLIFGGGNSGLMGELSRNMHRLGGISIGIIPQLLHDKGYGCTLCTEFIITPDMRDRKKFLESRSDAFIVLPGGFGTIEEFMEILTLKQLKYHAKPIIVLNQKGFYDTFLKFMKELDEKHFIKSKHFGLFHIAETVDDIFAILHEVSTKDHPIDG